MLSFPCWIRSLCTAGLALALIPLIVPGALGQEPAVGERIRIKTTSDRPQVVGVLKDREPEFLVVQTDATAPTEISWADISGLEVSRGTKSNAGKGALIGLGVGAAAGLGIALVGCSSEDGCDWDDDGTDDTAVTAVTLGLVGGALSAGVGALIGAAARTEKWMDVPPDRWRIEVAPDPNGGVAVGLNLRL